MTRPSTVVALLVVVLLHAALLVGGTVASGLALATFVLTHPGVRSTPSLLLPSAFAAVITLVLAGGDVVLGLRLRRAARRARVVLTVWLGLAGLVTLNGIVTSFTRVATPSIPFVTLWIVEVVACVAAVVLLWLPGTTAWLRDRSVRPAGPGL